jgi:KDO2-lipid IV(A) lauroyltransferase
MNTVVFYIFYSLNWLITLLPLRVLYVFSDIIFLFLYYFPGYRRNVVFTNLRNALPEKEENELKLIEKKFYRHLSDLIVETLKMTHMSRRELRKRMVFENPELLTRLYSEGKDICGVLGHYNNWEWMNLITELSDYTFMCVYKPLKNKHFDRFLNSLRMKNGVVLSPMSMVIRDLYSYRKKGVLTLSAYLADQTPTKSEINYWTTFLGQDTPVFFGTEKIAAKFDMAVVFFNVRKVKRGYYSARMELLFENAGSAPENLITETHVKRLDGIIRENPEYWIWSHRRWKHRREKQNG